MVVLPAAALYLLPSATCPACIAAYGGVLSALGLGFVMNDRVLGPVIATFLVIWIVSVAFSTRSHRHPGPLVATILGSAAVAGGRLAWDLSLLLYAGVAILVGAAIWNLWLKRRPRVERLQRTVQAPARKVPAATRQDPDRNPTAFR
jgi:hypothetical protein